ncbi:MAG: FhaA domain-containing protein [Vulcanimicrobiota bacterium]
MNFLDNLEKTLENLIENAFFGRFGGKIHPKEIARGIWRELMANKTRENEITYLPNKFLVYLSSENYNELKQIKDEANSEIKAFLRKEIEKRNYQTYGPLDINWEENPDLRKHEFTVRASFHCCDFTAPAEGEDIPTAIYQKLEVTEGFDRGKIFTLDKDEYVIGRDESCDIVLGDPTVSRTHARITRLNGQYKIEDMESKTGVFVNGQKVDEHILCRSHRLRIGLSILKLR